MFRHRSLDRLALLVLPSLLAAPLAAQAGENHGKEAHPQTAAAHHREGLPGHELVLPVTGMTPDKVAEVQGDLLALRAKEWVCPGCGHAQEMVGKCPKCDVELRSQSRSLVKQVEPSTQEGTVTLDLVPSVAVRLSVLEKALREAAVTVQREKLTLQGPYALVFEGATSQADANELQKALRDGRLSMAMASFDDGTRDVTVRGIEGMHTWKEVSDLARKSTKPARLVDVVWGGAMIHAS